MSTIEWPLAVGCTMVGAYRLRGPSVDAKTDVTFAGSAVAKDGTWIAGPVEVVAISAGVARIAVPHASAAVIKMTQ